MRKGLSTAFCIGLLVVAASVCVFAAVNTAYGTAGYVNASSKAGNTKEITVAKSNTEDEERATTSDQDYLKQLGVDAGIVEGIGADGVGAVIPIWADKSREIVLPVTRGSLSSVFSQAYRIGLLDQWVVDEIFQVTWPTVEYDYGKAAIEALYLSHKVTRGEWAHAAIQWKEAMQLPDFTCCMGDKPDFSDLDEEYIYAEDVKAAALAGLFCTREKTRVNDFLTMEELNKYIWKLASIQPLEVFSNTTDYTKYQTTADFMAAMAKESSDEELPAVYQDMIFTNFKTGMLPLDYLGRMNLDRELTVKDLTTILINCSDLHLIYAKLAKDNETCVPCSYLGIESYYDDILARLKAE